MKYEAVEPHDRVDILSVIFDRQSPHLEKVKYLLSSIHFHEADFFVEIFKRIMDGDDILLKIQALRAIEEAMQSKGTSIGASIFSAEIRKFTDNHPEYSNEMKEILSEVRYFQTLYSARD